MLWINILLVFISQSLPSFPVFSITAQNWMQQNKKKESDRFNNNEMLLNCEMVFAYECLALLFYLQSRGIE